MKRLLFAIILVSLFYFPLAQPVHASTPITITRVEDLHFSDPRYKFGIFFTPKISTFMPAGDYFGGCSFIFDYSNYNRFSSFGWNNDASDTESECIFLEDRNQIAGVDNTYTGKLNIFNQTSSGIFNPIGVSDFYTVTIPGKEDTAPSINFPQQPITIQEGATYTQNAVITDPDSYNWVVTADYGDGSEVQQLSNNGSGGYALSHVYSNYGNYVVTVSATDNQGQNTTVSQNVKVDFYTYHYSELNAPSSIAASTGFTNPEYMLVKDEGNWGVKTSDNSTVTFAFNPPMTSDKNINQLRVNFYYGASEVPSGVICTSKASTDQGEIIGSSCGFNSAGYSDNGFTVELPNNVHRVDSFTFTINSPAGSSFPLQIDYVEAAITYTNDFRPTGSAGGPYQVAAGQSIQLQGTGTDIDGEPISYAWDFNNDSTIDSSEQNPTFSAENLIPGVYPVRLTIQDGHSYSVYNTSVTVTNPRMISSVSSAKIWLGIKNILDIGVKFDIHADVYKNGTLLTSGQLNSVTAGLTGNFASAKLDTIPFNIFSPTAFPAGSQLMFTLSVRNACGGSLRNKGDARLWFDDAQANSQFGATIDSTTNNYFLLDNFILGTNSGSSRKTIDISVGSKCGAFKPFGTWVITP